MSVIKITDSIGATANISIRDDSPVAKAKLTELVSSAKEIVKSFAERHWQRLTRRTIRFT